VLGRTQLEQFADANFNTGCSSIAFGALHDFRHSHATLALEAGVHLKVVQERVGHATIAITLDTYSHAIPAMQEDAAEKIAALLER
jgi:integrase